jgi:hypothetical protein
MSASADAIDSLEGARREGRIARGTTMVAAGLLGALHMYWCWRGLLGVPLELSVSVHMNDSRSAVDPWAPWWVPTGILAALTTLLWRALAIRPGRVAALRGALALVIAALLAFPVAFMCLELGAVAQYNPMPSATRILIVLPLMVVGSVSGAAVFLMFHGLAFIPAAAILGLINAGLGKLMLRIGHWLRS